MLTRLYLKCFTLGMINWALQERNKLISFTPEASHLEPSFLPLPAPRQEGGASSLREGRAEGQAHRPGWLSCLGL